MREKEEKEMLRNKVAVQRNAIGQLSRGWSYLQQTVNGNTL